MAKPITSTSVLTGKAAKAFSAYIEKAKPSEKKQAMVEEALEVRDQLRPKR